MRGKPPCREPGAGESPAGKRCALSLLSRGGEASSRPRSCPTLPGHQGARAVFAAGAIWVVPRLYYSRPMERSVGRLFFVPLTRSRFHKHCTPSERPFCPHTALIFLAIRPGLLRKIALSAGKNSRHSAHPAYENNFYQFIWEDTMKELAKQYDPSQVEDRIYQFWLDGGYFHTKADPDKKPYTIVMPLRTSPASCTWATPWTTPCRTSSSAPSGCRAMPPCGCPAPTTLPLLPKPRWWRPCVRRA